MHEETNPYRTPRLEASSQPPAGRWSLIAEVGLGLQSMVLATYMFMIVDSDKAPSVIISDIHSKFHLAMAICSCIGLGVGVLATLYNVKWSVGVRASLVGLAVILFGLTAHSSHFFGLSN